MGTSYIFPFRRQVALRSRQTRIWSFLPLSPCLTVSALSQMINDISKLSVALLMTTISAVPLSFLVSPCISAALWAMWLVGSVLRCGEIQTGHSFVSRGLRAVVTASTALRQKRKRVDVCGSVTQHFRLNRLIFRACVLRKEIRRKRLMRGCVSERRWNLYQPSWQAAWLLHLASAAAEGKLKFGRSTAMPPVQNPKSRGQKYLYIFFFRDAVHLVLESC